MKPFTDTEKTSIVNNIFSSLQNIEKLNKKSYNFLNSCSGFIAHYDIYGFKAFYSEQSLQRDIEANASSNQWKNFTKNDRDYEYYMSKKDIYLRILGQIVARETLCNSRG